MRRIVQRGLFYEEFERGVIYEHNPGRTITEADNVLFTTLTMNMQSLHLDENRSARSEFGERLVNSLLTLSILVGLSVAQLTEGTIVANLGFDSVKFPAPVKHGDTLYAQTEVISKRLSASRPTQGIVRLRHTGTNQHDEHVAIVERLTLIHCLPVAGS